MSTGLIALLDDVASLAKVAAASLDDAAAHAGRASAKAAGIVVDDAAVTPRYVVGFAADRELPIIGKIAWGSIKNKLLILLPAALGLSLVAPWAITPLLMLGGAFLSYEGAEKVIEMIRPHTPPDRAGQDLANTGESVDEATVLNAEDVQVSGAIRTDLILSAEIMAIVLSTVAEETSDFVTQAIVLALVGIGITVLVYGVVALIVKADDVGLSLARNRRPFSSLLGLRTPPAGPPGRADSLIHPVTHTVGRALVVGMPYFLKLLSFVGTIAMLWVGGGILVHGFEWLGWTMPGHLIHDAAEMVTTAIGVAQGAVTWIVTALGSGLFGFIAGCLLIPVIHYGIQPLWSALSGLWPRGAANSDQKRG